jgi:hypothetical protein
MRLLRGLAGALLWILSLVLVLVALLLCVTVILLPVGIPLLGYARRLFFFSLRLVLPRALAHPVKTTEQSMQKTGKTTKKDVADGTQQMKDLGRGAKKKAKRGRKHVALPS